MYLRVIVFGGLLGFAGGVAEAIVKEPSLAKSVGIAKAAIGIAQSYAFQNMIFFCITYGIIAIIVTLLFDYEPTPHRFKRVMALAMLPLSLILTIAGIQSALRYPSLYDASDVFQFIAHFMGVLWLSQYVAHNYLREIVDRNQENKPVLDNVTPAAGDSVDGG